jgi:hypothetical protein
MSRCRSVIEVDGDFEAIEQRRSSHVLPDPNHQQPIEG